MGLEGVLIRTAGVAQMHCIGTAAKARVSAGLVALSSGAMHAPLRQVVPSQGSGPSYNCGPQCCRSSAMSRHLSPV